MRTAGSRRRRLRYVGWGVAAGLVVAVGGAAETFFGLIGSAFGDPRYESVVYAAEAFGVIFVFVGLALFAFAATRAVTATAYGAAAAVVLLVVDFVVATLAGPHSVDWSLVGFFVVRVAVPLVAARRAFRARSAAE